MGSKSRHVMLIHQAFVGPNAGGGTRHLEIGERPADIANAIVKLQKCPETRRRLGTSARDYVVRHFNRDQQAQEFAEILAKLAEPRPQ